MANVFIRWNRFFNRERGTEWEKKTIHFFVKFSKQLWAMTFLKTDRHEFSFYLWFFFFLFEISSSVAPHLTCSLVRSFLLFVSPNTNTAVKQHTALAQICRLVYRNQQSNIKESYSANDRISLWSQSFDSLLSKIHFAAYLCVGSCLRMSINLLLDRWIGSDFDFVFLFLVVWAMLRLHGSFSDFSESVNHDSK